MRDAILEVLARARKSPFYAARLSRLVRWSEIPPTTKADLRSGYPFGFLAVDRARVETYHESSGTEGRPIASCFTAADWEDIASRFNRNAVGLRTGDLLFVKTPYSMVTTAHQAHAAARLAGATVVPADNRSTNMPYARVVQVLADVGVTVSWSLPTETILWHLAARENGYPLEAFAQLRALWVAGEPLSAGKRRAIGEMWGNKPVYEDYGSTETGSLAGACRGGRLHLWSDRILFEVWSDGRASQYGRGQLLVTPLFREAMPLLRYLVEDEVEVAPPGCPCGSPLPTVRVLGRSSQALAVAGRTLYPLGIEDAVYRAGRAIGLSLWRGTTGGSELAIEYYAIGDILSAAARRFSREISAALGVPVRARRRPLGAFLAPSLLTERVRFAKPRFLYARGEKAPRGVQYA